MKDFEPKLFEPGSIPGSSLDRTAEAQPRLEPVVPSSLGVAAGNDEMTLRSQSANDSNFWRNRPVAVTGATGFVGGHVARLLCSQGARVRALARPTSDCRDLEAHGISCVKLPFDDGDALCRALVGHDIVFHLAGAVDFASDWNRYRTTNVEGTAQVLTAARRAGVRRLVMTSSIVAVGGSERPTVLDESAHWNLQSLRVPYVTTKRQAEQTALAGDYAPLDVVVVNPACVIGPGDFRSEFGVLCHRFWKGRVPFYFGGGSNFVDVRDVAAGHLAAAERGRAGERYLLAGTNLPWGKFFRFLAQASGRNRPLLRLPAAVGDWIAAIESHLRRNRTGRPHLSPEQARMSPLYFYFRHDKAADELGYAPRNLRATLDDMFSAWRHRELSISQSLRKIA